MADKKKAVLLRISPDLWERLSHWAQIELRSVNAQIEWALRESVRRRFGQRATPPEESPGEALNEPPSEPQDRPPPKTPPGAT